MSKPMRSVKVSEANQQFSRLIQQVEHDGVPIRIFRRNRPIARLVPDLGDKESDKARKAAFTEMRRLHKEGLDLSGLRVTRDDLYDRH